MNIKLHTPKSLKMGSGLSTLKQFLMSIVATSISIALTFGTAHVVDNYKKQKDKREMVMMLMYDMDQTMEAVNDCESEILAFYEAQVSLLANPDQFMAKQYDLYAHIPEFNYTQTTENIFKSSIETISTISNVLFVESVSEFYNLRQKFKSRVVDYMNEQLDIVNDITGWNMRMEVNYDDRAEDIQRNSGDLLGKYGVSGNSESDGQETD